MNIIININLTSFRRSGPQLGVQDNFTLTFHGISATTQALK